MLRVCSALLCSALLWGCAKLTTSLSLLFSWTTVRPTGCFRALNLGSAWWQVYDITSVDSFNRAKSWVRELQRQANPALVMALAGNKSDKDDERAVAAEEAQVPSPSPWDPRCPGGMGGEAAGQADAAVPLCEFSARLQVRRCGVCALLTQRAQPEEKVARSPGGLARVKHCATSPAEAPAEAIMRALARLLTRETPVGGVRRRTRTSTVCSSWRPPLRQPPTSTVRDPLPSSHPAASLKLVPPVREPTPRGSTRLRERI